MCGLLKSEWKRRTDWRCCSTDCTTKLEKKTVFWQNLRKEVFVRDKWSCVKCGYKPTKQTYECKIIPDDSALIGDHIIPIALGGNEWDKDNIQTLCLKCDKIKTKKDQGDIAKQRRIEKIQLNNKQLNTQVSGKK